MQRLCSACACLARSRTLVPAGSKRAYGVIPKTPKPETRAEERPDTPKPQIRLRRSKCKDVDGGQDVRLDITRADEYGLKRIDVRNMKKEASRVKQSSVNQVRREGNEHPHADLHRRSDGISSKSASPVLNHQSRLIPKSGKIHFKGLHHDTALPAFHRPSSPSHPIIKYVNPYVRLRAMPTSYIPPPPPSPFPSGLETHKDRYPSRKEIGFGVVASKNSVSDIAPERGRCRKRFKAAVENVVNGPGESAERIRGRLRSDWSYLAVLSREIYEVPMDTLCKSLVEGFDFINMQQERGIGAGSASRMGGGRRDRDKEGYGPRSRSGNLSPPRSRAV